MRALIAIMLCTRAGLLIPTSSTETKKGMHLRSRVRIELRPTENDSTWLYKNGDISVVVKCS